MEFGYENQNRYVQRVTPSMMAFVSLICGIFAVLGFATVIIPIVFGSLAVLFSVLSHTRTEGKHSFAKWGFRSGLFSLCGIIAICSVLITKFITDEEYRKSVDETIRSSYGYGITELIELYEDVYDGDDALSPQHEKMIEEIYKKY